MQSITANLKVNNVKETLAFYKDVLGFEVIVTVPEYEQPVLNWGMVKNGGAELMFQEKENLEEEYPVLKNDSDARCLTLFIKVNDLEGLFAKIKDKAQVIKSIHKTLYDKKEFAIVDNNGFVLTFAE
ncbi:bleomycin resistance family protein [Paenibacillus donghaensis]|uniref:VOC family protein n=1 Tax=Paenibacillus donghaensis TaxID=414771 RepID=UPI001883D416|nr:VOC family protein [Paenibacillus donghaensis]MBE9916629.1 bleomycin resistance family protein [Paenibacillus donghaensis]